MKKRSGLFNSTNRGRDTLHQTIRRSVLTAIAAAAISLFLSGVGTGVFWWLWSPEKYGWLITYCEAYPKSIVATVQKYLPAGEWLSDWLLVRTPTGDLRNPKELEARLAPVIWQDLKSAGLTVEVCWPFLFVILLVGYHRYGGWLGKAERERGQQLVTTRKIRRLIPRRHVGDFSLAGVTLPKGTECQHALLLGTSGTGKTTIELDLGEQIRAKKMKCLAYDPTGQFISTYYRPGIDHILNPYNPQSEHWSPFAEGKSRNDFKNLAAWLIPREDGDPFFYTSARSVLGWVMDQLPEKNLETLVSHLSADLQILSELLALTPAAKLVAHDNPKTSLSVLATISAHTDCLAELWGGERSAFSIAEWITRDDDSWLFLGGPSRQQEALKPLLSCWLEAAATSARDLAPSHKRRIFFLVDEFPTLQRLEAVPKLLAEGRKYGVSALIAAQSFAQIRETYGDKGAGAIAGLCSTFLTLRVPDADSAEWASLNLGKADLLEPTEAISYASGTHRDGYRLSEQRYDRSVVTPTEIMMLPDLQGFLKLSGNYPIVKVRVPYKNYPELHPSQVPFDEDRSVSAKLPELLAKLNPKRRPPKR